MIGSPDQFEDRQSEVEANFVGSLDQAIGGIDVLPAIELPCVVAALQHSHFTAAKEIDHAIGVGAIGGRGRLWVIVLFWPLLPAAPAGNSDIGIFGGIHEIAERLDQRIHAGRAEIRYCSASW